MQHFRFKLESWVLSLLRSLGLNNVEPYTAELDDGSLTILFRKGDKYSKPCPIGHTSDGFENCFQNATNLIQKVTA